MLARCTESTRSPNRSRAFRVYIMFDSAVVRRSINLRSVRFPDHGRYSHESSARSHRDQDHAWAESRPGLIDLTSVLGRHLQVTIRIISNVTSICGIPAGMGGIPESLTCQAAAVLGEFAFTLQDVQIQRRFDCQRTWCNDRSPRGGLVLLRGMSRLTAPPIVSKPSESGVISSSNSCANHPLRMFA